MLRRAVKILSILAMSFILYLNATAQEHGRLEVYKYMANDMDATFQPSIYFQSLRNWYIEARYNYEAPGAFSLYVGKSFSGDKAFSYSLTPTVGYSIGGFKGLSLAMKADTEWKDFYLSSQSQYSIALKTGSDNFFFSWSELGYNITENIFTGMAIQYTIEGGKISSKAGLLGGLSLGQVEIPIYIFSPLKQDRCFVVGITYQYNWRKKNK